MTLWPTCKKMFDERSSEEDEKTQHGLMRWAQVLANIKEKPKEGSEIGCKPKFCRVLQPLQQILERWLVHVMKHMGVLNPISNNLPLARTRWVSNSRHIALIPLVGSIISIRPNLQALAFVTIAKFRIHERQLIHVVKHIGIAEPNVQQTRENYTQIFVSILLISYF